MALTTVSNGVLEGPGVAPGRLGPAEQPAEQAPGEPGPWAGKLIKMLLGWERALKKDPRSKG